MYIYIEISYIRKEDNFTERNACFINP